MKPYIPDDKERSRPTAGLPKQLRKAHAKKKKQARRDKRKADRKELTDQLERGDWT